QLPHLAQRGRAIGGHDRFGHHLADSHRADYKRPTAVWTLHLSGKACSIDLEGHPTYLGHMSYGIRRLAAGAISVLALLAFSAPTSSSTSFSTRSTRTARSSSRRAPPSGPARTWRAAPAGCSPIGARPTSRSIASRPRLAARATSRTHAGFSSTTCPSSTGRG